MFQKRSARKKSELQTQYKWLTFHNQQW